MARLRCPRLCGRDGELAVLADAVRGGGMVLLSGPAGIGKSRLVAEAAALAEAAGRTVGIGRAMPSSGTDAYAPLGRALLQLVGQQGVPDDVTLAAWRAPLRAVLPGLVADVDESDLAPALVGEAVLQLVERLPQPVMVVLEDLHWADADTVAVLDYLADAVAGRRTAWLLTTRDESGLAERLRERRAVSQVLLEPLTPPEAAEMVRACAPAGEAEELIARVLPLCDGVPLFVEELVGSDGVPESFVEAVLQRWQGLGTRDRDVLAAAVVIGRDISPELVAAVVARPAEDVDAAVQAGLTAGLLEQRAGTPRFRHSLTREALLAAITPAARRSLAQAAIAAVSAIRPDGWHGLAAELALTAGDRQRAGELLEQAGQDALARGALATAVESLQRCVDLSNDEDGSARATLVAALSASGDIEAALAEGSALLASGIRPSGPIRLLLAETAARGMRWTLAAQHLAAVPEHPELAERTAILAAEMAFAAGDTADARRQVTSLLARGPQDAAVATRAHVLLGRIDRLTDLSAARGSFEVALATARAAHLPAQALDALHELGTIELLDFAGTRRLSEARDSATRLGAMGTLAVIDLQLAAAYLSQFDADGAQRHASSAYEIADRLGLHTVAAKALSEIAETYAQRREPDEMERFLSRALSRDPSDVFLESLAWGQCRGILAVLEGEWSRALRSIERAMVLLAGIANPEPVEFRALWPLMLAATGDPRAAEALAEAEGTNLTIAFANRGLLGYARAVLAGRAGDRTAATDLALRADAYLVPFPVWADLARTLAAAAAASDGWGRPDEWLRSAWGTFTALGFDALAARCARQLQPEFTEREGQVLALLTQGLSNKEIGADLHLSPRTVEKHVESLLRKSGRRSRTQLAVWAQGRTT